jgi:hypothetical protein
MIQYALPILAATLTGCAASLSTPSATPWNPTQAAALMHPGPVMNASGCSNKIIFDSEFNSQINVSKVVIYNRSGLTRCGQISGFQFASNLFVDEQNNLWVADYYAGHVYEFAPGASSPTLALNDPAGTPVDVAVDDRKGTVYVANYMNNGNIPGVVTVYAKGAVNPMATLSSSANTVLWSVAVDDAGNLYAAYQLTPRNSQGGILKWIGGGGAPTDLGISGPHFQILRTTKTGALLVCTLGNCGNILPGTTTLTNQFPSGFEGGFSHVALNQTEDRAFVAAGIVLSVWHYPGPDANPITHTHIVGSEGYGIATIPAAPVGAPF